MAQRERRGRRLSKGLLLFPLFLLLFGIGFGAEGKAAEVVLLHSNNVTGHLFACPT